MKTDELWAHNQALQRSRTNPHVLRPGDIVELPAPSRQPVRLSGGTQNRVKARIPQTELELRLLGPDGQAVANAAYRVVVDGKRREGSTDGDGVARLTVPVTAREGWLTLGPDDDPTELRLSFGQLDPHDDLGGVQQRLHNLGFHCGEPTGVMSPQTTAAIADFQVSCGLPRTGELDDDTRTELLSRHGS